MFTGTGPFLTPKAHALPIVTEGLHAEVTGHSARDVCAVGLKSRWLALLQVKMAHRCCLKGGTFNQCAFQAAFMIHRKLTSLPPHAETGIHLREETPPGGSPAI